MQSTIIIRLSEFTITDLHKDYFLFLPPAKIYYSLTFFVKDMKKVVAIL